MRVLITTLALLLVPALTPTPAQAQCDTACMIKLVQMMKAMHATPQPKPLPPRAER